MGKSQTTTLEIEGIGPVRLVKRTGMSRLRLTITPRGPMLSVPWLTPRVIALSFLAKNMQWIQDNMSVHHGAAILPGARIGKVHEVRYVFTGAKNTAVRTTNNIITVAHPRTTPYDSSIVQSKVRQAAIRVLKTEAEKYLPKRLEFLAQQTNLQYKEVRVRRMTSRWGSCSSTKLITLNIFLMQLPNELIDYVLVHELVHTQHMDHSVDFWKTFEQLLPGAKKLRKMIKNHSPILKPTYAE